MTTWENEKILDILYSEDNSCAIALNDRDQLIVLDSLMLEVFRFNVAQRDLYEFGKTLWDRFVTKGGLTGQ